MRSGVRLRLGPGYLVVGALAAVAIIGVLVAWRAVTLQREAEAAREHLVAARAALDPSVISVEGTEVPGRANSLSAQLATACSEAAAADEALRTVNGQLQVVLPVVGLLEGVPGVGDRTRAQATKLETGTQLAAAGSSFCAALAPLANLLQSQGAVDGGQPATGALRALVAARPRLLEAAQRFEQLEGTLSRTRDEDLDSSSRAGLAALRQRLPQVSATLRDALLFVDLLGGSGERRYLLVSQNPDELRATGGYIGSAGVVSLRDGAVGLVEYGSSRRYDTPADRRAIPPGPFQPYLGAGYWNLAAANWWPSFPDAAHQMAYFYGLSHPQPPVDGVIALDQVGFRHLLEVVGPVAIPEYGERVAADTLQGQIDRYVHAGDPDDELGRKHYMAALSTALLQRLLVAPRDELPRLVRAVRQSLDEQHLLVWMRDSSTAEMFARRHWDGDLLATDRDTLMLVDTEVSGSKQSQHVSRDAEYRVDLSEPGAPAAALTVTYTNASNREQQPDLPYFVVDYRTFLRVYAPPGAELTRAEGFRRLADSAEECGRTVFSGEVLIPQDSRVQVVLEYRLPQSVLAEGEYDVLVQQQPGVPPGHVLVSAMTPTGPVSPVELTSTPGQHAHWALRPLGEAAHFEDRPLPAGHAGGCSLPVVEARPIAPPVWLEIPAAHISAPIVDLGVADDGQMESPATPDVVGWYRMSARAGQPGNSVMSGHVDWGRNTAVFWGLRALRPGDRIEVRGADGLTHDYAVEWNTTLDARTAPAERLVGRSYDSLLTLITCDGVYDRAKGGYSERRIVRARLVT